MIHIYTGNGKGKTTAAIGLAMRRVGAGGKVCIIQFLKKGIYNELKSLNKVSGITIKQFGRSCLLKAKPTKEDKKLAKQAIAYAKGVIQKKNYDLLILDEINVALKLKLISLNIVCEFLKALPESVELVLTGRYAPKKLISLADYVAEIKEVKHPFKLGIPARNGIEF
ncbi:MAG: cob(I)yrinic acid a,c-diamide adenosyltransferase [Candidatus Omnitrophota bacterium]